METKGNFHFQTFSRRILFPNLGGGHSGLSHRFDESLAVYSPLPPPCSGQVSNKYPTSLSLKSSSPRPTPAQGEKVPSLLTALPGSIEELSLKRGLTSDFSVRNSLYGNSCWKKSILKGLYLHGVQKMCPLEKLFIVILITVSRHSVWQKQVLLRLRG